MEAPVPASALIHSATLVSAGIFLLLRFTPLFELSSYVYYILPVIGSFTAFFGGVCSAYQSDIKRILAYSTISHCGFLMVCFCTSSVEYTLLYLYIHGFFKAAVFLCVGNIIRFSRNYQDFRRMGGFFKFLPLEAYASLICLINLSGLPFTLGFYIKHLLLLGLPDYINMFIFLNVIGGALSGIIYSYRLYYYVFFDFKKSKKIVYTQASDIKLLSKFYSNTTIASSISIIGLILFSYIICLYYFNITINSFFQKSELTHFAYVSSNLGELSLPTKSLLKNISYVN
jgi:NADH-quinone oxidoreductase subunit L